MSLDYRLHDGYMNDDLPDEGQNHFAFLTLLMATGVPDVRKSEDLELFKERYVQWHLVTSTKFDREQVDNVFRYAELPVIRSMTTNIAKESDHKYGQAILDKLRDRADNIVNHYNANKDTVFVTEGSDD